MACSASWSAGDAFTTWILSPSRAKIVFPSFLTISLSSTPSSWTLVVENGSALLEPADESSAAVASPPVGTEGTGDASEGVKRS